MSAVVRVRLLGGFEVFVGARAVTHGSWRLRKAKTLVKILALEASHRIHRDRLAAELWPDHDSATARNNLHQALHAARRALSTAGADGMAALGFHDDLVELGAGCDVVIDLEELRSAVREAHNGDPGLMAAVVERWAQDLLPEDRYEAWAQPYVAGYRDWCLQQALRLADAWLGAGHPEAAVSLLAPVVRDDPLHEPAHRTMMRALAAAGRRSEALLLFERFRGVLDQELAAEPEPETREVFRELLSGADRAEPVAAPASRDAGNLPSAVVSLVGRNRELAEVDGLLERTRLLTLTGPGGAGKTTLAVELARRRTARYPAGVYLVELGGLTDGALLVPEMARAIGLQLASQASATESLVAQLRHRQMLVVLDNCEHLLGACAQVVAALLRGCPGVSVLATSREPLRTEGEIAWRTPSLALPDPAVRHQVAELSTVASVQLFVRRASAAAPGFALTETNAEAVAEICYRLDGMPLALELAAACAPALSPQQIADRLGDSLRLLRRGDRAAITRQQTLEATLAWSHDLLASEERRLFRRLAVFAGSFTLEAAEWVCGDGLPPAQVLDAVARLVDTSLVVADARSGVTRYRLLETVRQYATERALAARELSELQERHCEWYLRFAAARDPEQPSGDNDVSPASLDVEHDNLRAALGWSLHNRPRAAMELAVALWRYWSARGYFAEGSRWLEAAMAVAPEPSVLRARALLALAVFDIRRGSDQRLGDIASEALDVARVHGGAAQFAHALSTDAALAYMRGAWTQCWQRCLEACDVAAGSGAEHVTAAALHLQALVLLGRGDLPAATAAFDELDGRLQRLTDRTRPFFLPLMLGYAIEGGPTGAPRLYFEETVMLGGRVDAQTATAYVRCNRAYLARLADASDDAIELLHQACAQFADLGDRAGEALALNHLGCVHRARQDYRAGREAFGRSLRLRRALGDRRAIGMTTSNLGVLTAMEQTTSRGIALLDQALAGFEETGDVPGRAGTTLTAASVYAESGDHDAACELLQRALPGSEHIPGNHRATAWGYAMLGDILRRLGRSEEAERALDQAHERFAALRAVDGAGISARRSFAQTGR